PLGLTRAGDPDRCTHLTEQREHLPQAQVHALAHQHVGVVALGQQHLVFAGAYQLAPDVLLRIVDVALITQEDGVAGHQRAAIDERTVGADRYPAAAIDAHAQLVARVDPVGVLDLRVVAPQLGPVVAVAVVLGAEV